MVFSMVLIIPLRIPHAWHDPANGGSTCWAHASVNAKKWWGGIVIKNMNFDVKVGYNTSGQIVQ